MDFLSTYGKTRSETMRQGGSGMAVDGNPDILARLQALEDRAEIADIVNRYGDGVRTNDAALISSCFSADASIDLGLGGPKTVGREAILAHYSRSSDSPAIKSVQTFDKKVMSTPVMTNTRIDLDGDTAHCESTCLAIHVGYKDGEGKVIVRGTRNIDDLIRTDEGWKIQNRVHPALWSFDVPGSALSDAG
jgi:SnoaL-like domain